MIGISDCEIHGIRGNAGISPQVQKWLEAGARDVSPRDLVRLRVEGAFPWQRVWADRRSAGNRDEELLSFDEAAAITSEAACTGCLEDWLVKLGVDISRSQEEQRFVRLEDALDSLLLPVLEKEHERVARLLLRRPHDDGSGWGFSSKRSQPFLAYVELRGVPDRLTLSVEDQGHQLVCSVVNTFFPTVTPPPLAEVELSAGELPAAAHPAIVRWGHSVRKHLERCTD